VKVKWGKETLDNVEVSASEGLDLFKAQLFALTSVPMERQKILAKGKQLKEDSDLGKSVRPNRLCLKRT
jgi:ubiquitin carboxyl-terminal hydrolase 14